MLESLGVKLLDWGISQAADLLFEQTQTHLKQRLNKDDLQTAIALGVKAAKAHERELLAKLDDKQQRQFKQAVFSDSDVQGELQRPFRDEGKPRIEYLIAGFRKVAVATGKPLGENALKPWLEAFSDAYFEHTSALRFDLAKQDYCRQLINYYDELQFLGIDDVDPNEDSKAIESIFVMPDAVAERPPNQEGMNFLGRQAYFDWHETYSFEEEAADLGRQKALIQEQKRINESAEKQWSGAKVSASNLLNQQGKSKRVLLGAPGSGKTTLMSYFTVKLAKEALREDSETPVAADWGLSAGTLPILIRIRDLATKSDLTVLEYAAQFAKTTLGCQPLPGGFFERWLQEGKALILLDGLDEVAEDGKRQDIANKIDNFLRQEQFAQNPAIITSRPAGYYRSFFNTTDYPHYLLQPFDDGQIEQFISNWYDQRESSQTEADGGKESLRKALDEQERIKSLARNPLLLTIIALIHRWRAELPRDRHELYDRAVNTLIRTWDKKREITSHQVLQYLKLEDLRRLMEQVAYWVHTQGGTGEQQGGTLIDRDELVAKLAKDIQTLKRREQLERHETKAEAERFLDYIRDRTGLLNEQGKDRYAFVHKTFQEYLTTQEIRDRQEDEGIAVALDHIRDHLHDAHWREVLLLLIAQQKRSNPGKCLEAILSYSSCPYEKWLHRNLFFAANCLAENVAVAEDNWVNQILEDLVALEVEPTTPSNIRQQVFKALCGLAATQYEPLVLHRLMNVPEGTIKEDRLRNYRAELGDRLNVIEEYLILFADSDSGVRYSAAEAVGKLGKNLKGTLDSEVDGNVLEALVNWLETHPDLEGVSNAVDALWSLVAEV